VLQNLIVDIRHFKCGLWPGHPSFLCFVLKPAFIVARQCATASHSSSGTDFSSSDSVLASGSPWFDNKGWRRKPFQVGAAWTEKSYVDREHARGDVAVSAVTQLRDIYLLEGARRKRSEKMKRGRKSEKPWKIPS
jgi:hypothetical protein